MKTRNKLFSILFYFFPGRGGFLNPDVDVEGREADVKSEDDAK
jgi:hypothetical protein